MLDQRAMLASEPDLATEPPSDEATRMVPGEPLVTVCGVPLEGGERVVFFARPRHTRNKLAYILAGVVLAPLLVGIAFIAYGLLYERWHLRFVAVTNRRIVIQRGARPARWLRLDDVVEVRARRGGAPTGAIAAQARETGEPTDAKTDPTHWSRANAVIVTGRAGTLSIDESVAPETLGPALAHVLWTEGYLDRVPTVHHPV
jgi:hypothetical protein